jgi:hypothetical protein
MECPSPKEGFVLKKPGGTSPFTQGSVKSVTCYQPVILSDQNAGIPMLAPLASVLKACDRREIDNADDLRCDK